ncbi:MAG: Ribulose-phosphate 3-epimerase [Candidatus Magasanikbacteria bacterium GW2011_GWC2_37_14]|uniref:Ribulose-phosphate 3-epimerase n=1 Tax=Candidatus Magasanikbacteria bacterium GW2011_GWC2_37_14 TaxID=1619046 RepID=A0A0G0JHG2_9BACT|nr:MAG: Ribulose-phosphate 3-epimerase [Candidatus Magasanikbacteria bacterium GW2011_GWC2_37_14]
MQIIPSILVTSEEEFTSQINSVQNVLNQVQLDIADGKFVPSTTWAEPEVVQKICKIAVELHLMVEEPLKELQRWVNCSPVNRVLIHLESKNVDQAIIFAKKNNWQVGLVLNPETNIENLEKYLEKIDTVMFMGIVPGKQGQKLIPEVLHKALELNATYPTLFTEWDGGVNEDTLPDIYESSIQAVCPGSAIFKNNFSPEENLKKFTEIIHKLTIT